MKRIFNVLDDLGYVLETIGEGMTGEARSCLRDLEQRISLDPSYELSVSQPVKELLFSARGDLLADDTMRASYKLSRVCRALWREAKLKLANS